MSSSDTYTLLEVFFLFVAPVLAVRFHRGTPTYRLVLFCLILLAAGISAFYRHLDFYHIGIRIDNLLPASLLYAPFVILSTGVLWLCSRLLRTQHRAPWKDPLFIPIAVFLSAGQQFLYQGFLLQRLSGYGTVAAICATALLYGFLHTIFPRPLFNFVLTVFGGIMFATLYTLEPNLFVASLAHTVLNIAAVQFSFVAFVDKSGLLERV